MGNIKQLSNPFSTGGGGGFFEANVQAAFVVLMLTGGYAPCLPCWPIRKIKLQGKFEGYTVDDLIVFAEQGDSDQKCKMLCQIKHSIAINESDNIFRDVIQAAWNDFNNDDLFTKGKDVIALITGPLSSSDVNDVRTVLEWARHTETSDEFFRKVGQARFSSSNKQNKLQVFRTNLMIANGGNSLPDDTFFEFLKHYHLLGYDLDIKAGVTLSLLHSLIGQYSRENALSLWSRILEEVQSANKNAGTISRESLAEDIKVAFKKQVYDVIPDEYSPEKLSFVQSDWNSYPTAATLSLANLIGSWNEKCIADLNIIEQITNTEYKSWITSIRESLQQPDGPISFKNGIWRVTDRDKLWQVLGGRLFDDALENFKKAAVIVLSEIDPRFELPIEERYAASIHGKVLKHSTELRQGIVESLALLGTRSDKLIQCSQNKSESIAVLVIREILNSSDWLRWGSLDQLLPLLAESAPDEFLDAVEKELLQSPCAFDKLFLQEGAGFTGGNYLTGLLWSLEGLAWDETYFIRACVLLGELAARDPGGKWANRPGNSLMTILLPWIPRTKASLAKRKVALQTLQKENPVVAWKLLLSLLPNPYQVSMSTFKPRWRVVVPEDSDTRTSKKEYDEQVLYCAELALSTAGHDVEKLHDLIGFIDKLPRLSFEQILDRLSSVNILNKPENERLSLWTGLTDLLLTHRRFPDAKWVMSNTDILKIEVVAGKLAPTNPFNLHRRLFDAHDYHLYEKSGNWSEQQQILDEHRQQAVTDIYHHGGIGELILFAKSIEYPYRVGYSLGCFAEDECDSRLLPVFIDTTDKKLEQFISGYISSKQCRLGWAWVDRIDKTKWSVTQLARFLISLPFVEDTWTRCMVLLNNSESEYWKLAVAIPSKMDSDLRPAIDKLIEYGRPHAAINCIDIDRIVHKKEQLDKSQIVRALLATVSSTEPSYVIDSYHIIELIKVLQNDPSTDPDELFRVEWAYLALLDRDNGAAPKMLENRLASDPSFYCEVIRLIYRSKFEKKPSAEPAERDMNVASNVWKLLYKWRTPPGIQQNGLFVPEQFLQWLHQVKAICTKSGHLEAAFSHIGQVLFYCLPDPDGFWINRTVASALNDKDADEMRNGFSIAVYNSRGVRDVDPTGEPERQLSKQYRQRAEITENAGYQRFAVVIRQLAESYERHAQRIISEHSSQKQ